jgi:hypothetical protein
MLRGDILWGSSKDHVPAYGGMIFIISPYR